jgi:hypothetical protein
MAPWNQGESATKLGWLKIKANWLKYGLILLKDLSMKAVCHEMWLKIVCGD